MIIDACYFCTTPYQLISAISLVKHNHEKADLYIINRVNGADRYARAVEELHLFYRVKVIDYSQILSLFVFNGPIRILHLSSLISYLFCDNIIEEYILFKDTDYKKMYVVSRGEYIRKLTEFYYVKHQKDVEIVFYEDGVGSYTSFKNFISLSKADSLITKLLLFEKKPLQSNKFYLYSPDVFRRLHPDIKCFSICQIENICKIDKDLINRVFDTDKTCGIMEPIILLDTIPSDSFDEVNAKEYGRLIDEMVNCFGENMIIKPHPRDQHLSLRNCSYYKNTSIPFEVVMANSDIMNKVLITYYSTAIVSPKVFFDQEPYTIVLCNLLDTKSRLSIDVKSYFSSVKDTYRDQSRFIIPENEDELFSEIRRICAELRI